MARLPDDANALPPAVARRLRELETLYDSLRLITSTLDLGDLVRKVLDAIATVTSAEALSLLLYDEERDELVFAASEMLSTETLGRAGTTGDAHVASAADGEVLTVAIRRDAAEIGAIEVRGPLGDRSFGDADRARLERVADQLAVNLDAAALAHDALALEATFARIAAAVPSRTHILTLRDADGRELVFGSSHALRPGVVDGLRLKMDQGIAGWVARHREALCLENAGADPRHDPTIARQTGLVPRTMISVPLVHRDALVGVVQVINKAGGGTFSGDEVRLVQTLANQAAGAIAQAQLYRRVEQASLTDDLTGLGNTRRFYAELPAQLARGDLSLLVLDLDGLKRVVDGHGHLVGSRTVATVGRLIGECLRPGDTAARFGGDEFVVILPGTGTAVAAEVAATIRQAIADCAHPDGSDVDIRGVTASLGVATSPAHGRTPEELFRAADTAMYRVKFAGKNGIAVATPEESSAPAIPNAGAKPSRE